MAQSILYRWFGLGGLSRQKRTALESEGIVFAEEGIWFSVEYKNYKSPVVRNSWRKEVTVGSIVMTQKRLVAYRNFSLATTVEILIGDPPNEKLHIDIDGGAVCIHFDAADFLPKHSGQVTLRFKTPHASDINALIHPA